MSFFFIYLIFLLNQTHVRKMLTNMAKNISNTQNDKPQSQIKAKLFNI